MTPTHEWFLNQSNQFKAGYTAYCACQPFDKTQSQEWQKGWLYAAESMEY